METSRKNCEHVPKWLALCLSCDPVVLRDVHSLRNGREREVWDCTFEAGGRQEKAIVAVFKPGSLESVNTSLPPHQAAQKCALALTELPALGIPTPRLLGHAEDGEEAAIVSERIDQTEWQPRVRIQAAEILAYIHNLEEGSLSEALQDLARMSDVREQRTTGGHGSKAPVRTLVHGDYFSANILPVVDGLRVIDWETFGWGDPMWDLGFLIGADRGLPQDEVEAVIREYEAGATVDRQRLMWHKRWWSDYWRQRGIIQPGERGDTQQPQC